jgi:hypothetical protein
VILLVAINISGKGEREKGSTFDLYNSTSFKRNELSAAKMLGETNECAWVATGEDEKCVDTARSLQSAIAVENQDLAQDENSFRGPFLGSAGLLI